ncbi:MAG: hypothetical protein ABR865_10945 [Terracidiphilus sp.]
MDLAFVRKVLAGGAGTVVVVLLVWATVQAQVTPNTNSPKMAILHATVTITGGLAFTGSYDDRLSVRTCADVARDGTGESGGTGGAAFDVPIPPPDPGGNPGPVGGGHTFSTDVAAWPYHGPGTYTGSGLTATQMDVDTPPGSQDTHIFAFPTGVGTLIVKPDASGSFQFTGLQDPGSVTISGQVIWTCS